MAAAGATFGRLASGGDKVQGIPDGDEPPGAQ